MKLTNWLGQDIEVGSYVYRGARMGNGSTFKIGKVIKIDHSTGSARVDWKVEAPHRSTTTVFTGGVATTLPFPSSFSAGRAGTCHRDTLVVIDRETYAYALARKQAELITTTAFKEKAIDESQALDYYRFEVDKWLRYYNGDGNE